MSDAVDTALYAISTTFYEQVVLTSSCFPLSGAFQVPPFFCLQLANFSLPPEYAEELQSFLEFKA